MASTRITCCSLKSSDSLLGQSHSSDQRVFVTYSQRPSTVVTLGALSRENSHNRFSSGARPRVRSAQAASAMPMLAASAEEEKEVRSVVEHLTLYKITDAIPQVSEQEMVDHLYTLQYHYSEILNISLGRIFSKRSNGFTHASFVRFPSKDSFERYKAHPATKEITEKYVAPFCEGTLEIAFEAEVERDIEALFRRGEEFEQGVEHLVLLKAKESATEEQMSSMIDGLKSLPAKMSDVIVQLTAGSNFLPESDGYTHGLVVRLPSEEDLDLYNKHPSHREVLRKNILPISAGLLAVDFLVDPVGETVAT